MIAGHNQMDRKRQGLESRNAVESAITSSKGGRSGTWEEVTLELSRTIRPWRATVPVEPDCARTTEERQHC